jgi:hypothetical protein
VISRATTTQDESIRISTPPILPSRQAFPNNALPGYPAPGSVVMERGNIPQTGDIRSPGLTGQQGIGQYCLPGSVGQ